MLISALEHRDRLPVLERHDRFLPARRRAAGATPGDFMTPHLHGADARRGDPEELLQRLADLVLVGVRMHHEGVLLARLPGGGALLRDERTHDGRVQDRHHSPSFLRDAFLGAAFFAAFGFAVLGAAALAFFTALAFLTALGFFAAFGSEPSIASPPPSAACSTTRTSAHSTWYAVAS